MRDLCGCDGNSRGELILAAIVAFVELGIFWFQQQSASNKSELGEELQHFKDESRYLRSELERERQRLSDIEAELRKLDLAIEYEEIEEETEEE